MSLLPVLLSACLILNEVLHNPPGPESGAGSAGDCREFVELYNTCDSSVSLTGLTLDDNVEQDTLLPWQDTALLRLHPGVVIGTDRLGAGAFAVILDPEYPTAACAAHPLLPIAAGAVVLRPGDTDIGNGLSSNDTLGLHRGMQLLDRYPGNLLTGDGHAVERWNPRGDGGDPASWRENPSGSTPGAPNRTARPLDLGLSARQGEGDTLWVLVWNGGYLDAQDGRLRWRGAEGTDTVLVPVLMPGDTYRISRTVPVLPSLQVLQAVGMLPGDTVPTNDTLWLYRPGTLDGLRMTEILPNGVVEWVELWNASSETLRIREGVLMDAAGARGMLPDTLLLPGAFVVLTGDPGAVQAQYGDIPVWEVVGFPVLNNRQETLRLVVNGVVQDSAVYRVPTLAPERSLERWSIGVDAFDPAAWTESQATAGSTPAAPNSVWQRHPTREAELWLSHRVLRPGEARLRIRYALPLPSPLHVIVRIYDDRGRAVRVLRDERATAAQGEVLWDGTDDQGQRLLPGMYVIWVEGEAEGRRVRVRQTVALWHR